MPRAGVTTDRVVTEAAVLADEVGLESITLAEIASRLGIRLPSLYKHIDGLAGLRAALSEEARRELAAVMRDATVGRSGDAAVMSLATAMRSWAKRHPGRYAATVRGVAPSEPASPGTEEAMQVLLDVLAGYDLSGSDAVDAVRGLRAAIHGFVSLEAAGGFAIPVDVDRSFERLISVMVRSLRAWG